MVPKKMMTALLPVAVVVLAFFVRRPMCGSEQAVAKNSEVIAREPLSSRATVTPGLAAVTNPASAAFVSRRNLFAFVDAPAPRPSVSPRAIQREETAAPIPATSSAQPVARDPEFPFKYIGRFGAQDNPIAVFVADGNVLNAQVGDLIAGQFRLSGIGIESVEVAVASGARQRVAIRP